MIVLTLISLILVGQAKAGAGVSFEDKVLGVIPDDAKALEIQFSNDGRLVAFKCSRGAKVFLMVNKEKSPDYDGLDSIKIGATGKIAYRATPDSNSWVAVFGGQTFPPLPIIGPLVISPDGSKVAYAG